MHISYAGVWLLRHLLFTHRPDTSADKHFTETKMGQASTWGLRKTGNVHQNSDHSVLWGLPVAAWENGEGKFTEMKPQGALELWWCSM